MIKIYSVKLKFGKILSLAPLNLSILVRIFSRESIITSAFDLVLIRKYKIRLGDGAKFDCYSTNFKINKGWTGRGESPPWGLIVRGKKRAINGIFTYIIFSRILSFYVYYLLRYIMSFTLTEHASNRIRQGNKFRFEATAGSRFFHPNQLDFHNLDSLRARLCSLLMLIS